MSRIASKQKTFVQLCWAPDVAKQKYRCHHRIPIIQFVDFLEADPSVVVLALRIWP